jgi:hypothetical protein
MHSFRLLIFTLLAACLFFQAPAFGKEQRSEDDFHFDLTWRQKPRVKLKVWGTMKGKKSCKNFKATIFFGNTRRPSIAVSTDIEIKNYKKNSVVEISEVLKVKGTSKTGRYWVLDKVDIVCEN